MSRSFKLISLGLVLCASPFFADLILSEDENPFSVLYQLGNESVGGLSAPCQLFRNNDDGTFTDVARQAGVTNDRFTKAVMWGDYDGDRVPALYVSNQAGHNRLYHNNDDGTFAACVSHPAGTTTRQVHGGDFDGDNDVDICATSFNWVSTTR